MSPRQLGDRIRRSICDPLVVQQGLTYTWLSMIFMGLAVLTIQTGSTNAKMAKLAVSGDHPG